MRLLGGMFHHIKESQMEKSYAKVIDRYENSSYFYQHGEIPEP